jgi:hypothetical protein
MKIKLTKRTVTHSVKVSRPKHADYIESEVVMVLRGLDEKTFRNAIKKAKRLRKGDKISQAVINELNHEQGALYGTR